MVTTTSIFLGIRLNKRKAPKKWNKQKLNLIIQLDINDEWPTVELLTSPKLSKPNKAYCRLYIMSSCEFSCSLQSKTGTRDIENHEIWRHIIQQLVFSLNATTRALKNYTSNWLYLVITFTKLKVITTQLWWMESRHTVHTSMSLVRKKPQEKSNWCLI
jgi:hypothetical protein